MGRKVTYCQAGRPESWDAGKLKGSICASSVVRMQNDVEKNAYFGEVRYHKIVRNYIDKQKREYSRQETE